MVMEATGDFRDDSPRNVDELGQYRSLSTLAVAAFLLGLGSVFVFVTSALIVIPLAAIAVAALAQIKIHSSAGAQSGSWLARAGLVLAIVFSAAAFSRATVRDSLSIRLAEEAAQRWLTALSADRLDDALEMMSPTALMNLRPQSGGRNAPPSPFVQEVAVDMLRQSPLLHALEPAEDSSEVRFHLLTGAFFSNSRVPEVGCKFEAEGTHVDQVEFNVVLKRILSPKDEVAWAIDSWALINPPARDFMDSHRH